MTKKRKYRKIKTHEEELKQAIQRAGIASKIVSVNNDDALPDLMERIHSLQKIKFDKKKRTMLYFVMYDIENDKVRRLIAKYLERKGLMRIQKSIFIGDTQHRVFDEIRQTLAEVQQAYANHNSLILVPISVDEVRSMKIIGKHIDLDLVLGNQNTLII